MKTFPRDPEWAEGEKKVEEKISSECKFYYLCITKKSTVD